MVQQAPNSPEICSSSENLKEDPSTSTGLQKLELQSFGKFDLTFEYSSIVFLECFLQDSPLDIEG